MKKTWAEPIHREIDEFVSSADTPQDKRDHNPVESQQIQAKLMVGGAHDPAEREADQVADQVVGAIRRKQNDGVVISEGIRRKEGDAPATPGVIGPQGGEAGPEIQAGIAAASGGQPLAPDIQSRIEATVGQDLSAVRVHTDGDSDTLNRAMSARAFTTGNDIFFSNGAYQPDTPDGARLIAHEATHVVQQGGGAQRKFVRRELARDGVWDKDQFTAGLADEKDGDNNDTGYKAMLKSLDDVSKKFGYLSNARQNLAAYGPNPKHIDKRSGLNLVKTHADNVPKLMADAIRDTQAFVKDKGSKGSKFKRGFQKKGHRNARKAQLAKAKTLENQLLGKLQATKDAKADATAKVKEFRKTEKDRVASDRLEAQNNLDNAQDQARFSDFGFYQADVQDASFGAGAMNTVAKVNYRGKGEDGGDFTAIFKPEKAESVDVMAVARIDDEKPNFALRSVAASKLNKLLGLNVIPRTELAFDMQLGFGQVMELASGRSPKSSVKTEITDANPKKISAITKELQKGDKIVEKDGKQFLEETVTNPVQWDSPYLRRELTNLQLFDVLIGQMDRHAENYFIAVDSMGHPNGVKGIDNDLAFGVGTTDINQRDGHQMGMPPAIDGQVAARFCAVTPKQVHDAVAGLLTKNEIGSLIIRLEQIKTALMATDTNGFVIPRIASDLSGMDDWANVDDSDYQTSYFARDKAWQLEDMDKRGRLLAPVEAHHFAKDRLAELIAAAEKTTAEEAKKKLLETEGNHPGARKRIKK